MATSPEPKLGKLKRITNMIKEYKILDAAAKAVLGSALPPPFGQFLVNLYENASGNEEDKTKQAIQILENLQKFNQQQFDELEIIIYKNGEEIKNNQDSLSKLQEITILVASKLDEIEDLIHQLLEKGTNETDQIKEKINKLENNLVEEIQKLGVSKFDYNITAEQLLFYLKLKYFLDNAYNIYKAQNKIAHNLLQKVLNNGNNITTNKEGLDYALYNLHENNVMDRDELKIFDYIRKVTNDTERFNWYAKELLLKNEDFVRNSDLLRQLMVHYSTWQAKYQLYKEDPNMCLIYVGPDEMAGFPKQINNDIKEKIDDLKEKTKLIGLNKITR